MLKPLPPPFLVGLRICHKTKPTTLLMRKPNQASRTDHGGYARRRSIRRIFEQEG